MPKKTKKTAIVKDTLSIDYHFPVAIYSIMKPEYLDAAKEVCEDYVEQKKLETPELDEIYPVYQTKNFADDPRMKDLAMYILNTAWNILDMQGYDMSESHTFFDEFWCQEHHKHSSMEQHIHNNGTQLVGFYFVECPEKCSKVLFHDPKAAKVQISLKEKDMNAATYASNIINFEAKPGMLMITNSWLAHAFSRHASDDKMRFIHFTVFPQRVQSSVSVCTAAAEVI